MSSSQISILDFAEQLPPKAAAPDTQPARRRSNSQSQGVAAAPSFMHHTKTAPAAGRQGLGSSSDARPAKRHQAEYYVTLVPLNDTFVKKHIHVPYFPDTARLGRPTGTKVKPHVNNGYFDLRVLSRNHACMYIEPKLGRLMIQDMGLSNGTFVNLDKIGTEPVPVLVGDVVNLGFNIQVETSHKQISMRVDNVLVVSNNPKGALLTGLPRLTRATINAFSDAEMKHFDFIQSLFAQLLDKKDAAAVEESPPAAAARAFENAMFADIVPTLDDTLAAAADSGSAGIFSNARIVHSGELQAALDTLTVNLAKIKQQNSTLRLLESFFASYLARVNELNGKYLRAELAKCDHKVEASVQAEKARAAKLQLDQDRKLAEQKHVVAQLKAEVARLVAANEDLARDRDASDDALSFGPERLRVLRSRSTSKSSRRLPAADDRVADDQPAKTLKDISPEESEEVEEVSNSSDVESEDLHRKDVRPVVVPGPSPYVSQFHELLSHYKNQGVLLGFVVVVMGFVYKNTGS